MFSYKESDLQAYKVSIFELESHGIIFFLGYASKFFFPFSKPVITCTIDYQCARFIKLYAMG